MLLILNFLYMHMVCGCVHVCAQIQEEYLTSELQASLFPECKDYRLCVIKPGFVHGF